MRELRWIEAGRMALPLARPPARRGRTVCLWALLFSAAWSWVPPARAIELCGDQSKQLMRSVGITEQQIERLCEAAAEASRLTRLSLRRVEDEAGYCRVTLALRNDSIHHIDSFALTSENGRFEIFRFADIIPGRTGYASGLSRSLMDCEELRELAITLLWPGTVRADGRPLQGRLLDQFQPVLLSEELQWKK
jgi:hypothetical protein